MVSISIFDGIKVKTENLCTVWNKSIKTVNTQFRLPQIFTGALCTYVCQNLMPLLATGTGPSIKNTTMQAI